MPNRKLARTLVTLAVLALGAAAGSASSRRMLVICSPGSPGTTAQAQPTLDAFAAAAAKGAGWPADALGAVYFESEAAGIPRLGQNDAVLAMVPLPFLVQHGEKLSLTPKLAAVAETGPTVIWSLVAKKGMVSSAAGLDGWELTGTPGYAERFVRSGILSGYGSVPAGAKITFTPRPLSALRRAAAGEKVAVLLDAEQTAALASLPFASDLEVLHRSKPLPGGYLCVVGDRLGPAESKKLLEGLARLHDDAEGREILKTMRMTRFEPLDPKALDEVRRQSAAR